MYTKTNLNWYSIPPPSTSSLMPSTVSIYRIQMALYANIGCMHPPFFFCNTFIQRGLEMTAHLLFRFTHFLCSAALLKRRVEYKLPPLNINFYIIYRIISAISTSPPKANTVHKTSDLKRRWGWCLTVT